MSNLTQYEFLPHTADVKIRAYGKTWEEMFMNVAAALNETIRGNIRILERKTKIFTVTGKDKEVLLHNLLEEFIFLLEAKDFLCSRITKLDYDEEELSITVTAVGDEAEKYKFTNDVKAITYSEMYIKEQKETYTCQVVLDV